MAMKRKTKVILALSTLVVLFVAYEGIRIWWYHGFSNGTRTGVIRKISVKGSPICKYLDGELAMQGGQLGQPAEVFNFSVDDHADNNPIVQSLHDAEKTGARVTLDYRQDLKAWWRCNPHE